MNLFAPLTDSRKFHKHFSSVVSEPENYSRKVLSQWAEGFVDRDGKFVKEFQTTFNSSFWELYIFACLKELGFAVDFSFDRPDFIVNTDDLSFCIEASISNSAIGTPDECQASYDEKTLKTMDRESLIDFATIRLSNTLTSKYKKLMNNYSKLDQVKDKPFVIAIAPFEQPFSYLQNDQAITRVLYGFDKFIHKDFPEKNERIIFGQKDIGSIPKSADIDIPLGYFAKGQMNEVSAVIFSNTATFGKVRALSDDPGDLFFESVRYNDFGLRPFHTVLPKKKYHETLLDGLHIFHNPFATYPLKWENFDRNEITFHGYDLEKGTILLKTNHKALFQRSNYNFNIPSRRVRLKINKLMRKINKQLQKGNVKTDQPLSIKEQFEDYF